MARVYKKLEEGDPGYQEGKTTFDVTEEKVVINPVGRLSPEEVENTIELYKNMKAKAIEEWDARIEAHKELLSELLKEIAKSEVKVKGKK